VIGERAPLEASGFERVASPLRIGRAHAGQQLQHAKSRDPVPRIARPAQHRQQVLDVRGFEKLEPAVFDEWHVASHQFEFEHVAVVGRAKQHCLPAQLDAALAGLEHAVDDERRLRLVIEHRHVLRPRAAAA
jgi:hypothetical protein